MELWRPTEVQAELFDEENAPSMGGYFDRDRMEMLMSEADIIIEEIIYESKYPITSFDLYYASNREKAKMIKLSAND